MTSNSVHQSHRMRHGMTLFELLVALAIVIVLLGLTYPSLQQLVRDNQITSTTEDLRAIITETRIRAIENGVTYEFRFEPSGQRFVVLPADSGLAQAASGTAPAGATPTTANQFWKVSGKLPDELHIQAQGGATVASQTLPSDYFVGLDDAAQLGQVSWSAPLLFLPDGSSSDESLEVMHTDKEHFVTLSIRGLTGAVSVSRIQRGAN